MFLIARVDIDFTQTITGSVANKIKIEKKKTVVFANIFKRILYQIKTYIIIYQPTAL